MTRDHIRELHYIIRRIAGMHSIQVLAEVREPITSVKANDLPAKMQEHDTGRRPLEPTPRKEEKSRSDKVKGIEKQIKKIQT